MRFVRFQQEDMPPTLGWVLDDMVGIVEGSLFGEFRRMEPTVPLKKVKLLPPVQPSKIVCVGRNYAAHAEEHDAEVPKIPLIFLKPPSALIGHEGTILIPPQSQQVEHEAELVVVIGRKGRWIPADEALDYVFGYTIGNDVTARDLQFSDGQWTRGKGFDTFCPLGPWIDTELDAVDGVVTCHVNGQMRQMASTRDMVFTVPQLIAFISTVMEFEPGDVLFTGTPAGVGPLLPDDVVEVSVERLGTLRNYVAVDQRGFEH